MSEQISQWVIKRRAALADAKTPADGSEIWGLALSGGGIRSATFCFGLLRALAKYGALPRFDLLSTVSGGGYIGSVLGKLFHHARDARDVRDIYKALQQENHNWLIWWLRANGRYLIPRGFKDTVFAVVLYLQNLAAVHIELGVLVLLLAMVLALVNIGSWTVLAAFPALLPAMPYAFRWLPTLWLLLLPLAFAVFVCMASYWTLPEPGREGRHKPAIFIVMAVLGFLALFYLKPQQFGVDRVTALWLAALATTLGSALAVPVARFALCSARRRLTSQAPKTVDANRSEALMREEARHLVTKLHARLARAASVVLIAGAVDRLAWFLAFDVDALSWLTGGLVTATVLLRTLLPKLVPSSTTVRPVWATSLSALGNIAGYLMLFGVVLLWLTGFDRLLFTVDASPGSSPLQMVLTRFDKLQSGAGANPSSGGVHEHFIALLMIAGLFAYAWITRHDFSFLNLSSLHNFYRARITRGFLGAANGTRFPVPPPKQTNALPHARKALPATPPARPPNEMLHALDAVHEEPPGGLRLFEVSSVHGNDDVAMADYQPHQYGGPVHLINVCINETRDRRGGLFNQDRRGIPMVVGAQARVRVGSQPWQCAHDDGALTLGRWTAISGAAFAPGLGQMTRGGVAALSTLAGLRLGYWWPSPCLETPDARVARRRHKLAGLIDELLGNFEAEAGLPWYLSDGGHYENTAALALLAEKATLIVLADCGADPHYGFSDLENLVRKSRIDLQAEIEFLRPIATQPDQTLDYFGSLDDLASPDSVACLALARIRYAGVKNPAYLVLVKPNLSVEMTADLVNFKRDHPDFPQESTTDQFFGEAQWESYFKLGRILGHCLSEDFLRDLPPTAKTRFEDDRGSVAKHLAGSPASAKEEKAPHAGARLPARIAGSAMATSIGLGAVATVAISAWQAIDGVRVSYADNRQAEQSALKDLADRYGNWREDQPASLGALAGSVLHAADRICHSGDTSWFSSSLLAQCILQDVDRACNSPPGRQIPACRQLLDSHMVVCLRPPVARGAAQYWNYAFSDPTLFNATACHTTADAASAKTTPGANAQAQNEAPAGAPTAPDAPAEAAKICVGKTVYVQVFGGAQRSALGNVLGKWRALGASVPPIEDVLDSSRRAGRPAPHAPGPKTRTYFHDEAAEKCATALLKNVGNNEGLPKWDPPSALPARLRHTPGTIEVWIAAPPEEGTRTSNAK